jgi:hypothetical protein
VKKVLLLVFVVAMVWVVLNRQRMFVRDPLATVYKTEASRGGKAGSPIEVKQSGVQVFINYSNDVLLWQDDAPAYRILVQGWNKAPGMPVRLTCVHWMMCLTDADHAQTFPLESTGKGRYDPKVAMSSREVSFVDGDGGTMRVTLR